jgi:hypothetical protein
VNHVVGLHLPTYTDEEDEVVQDVEFSGFETAVSALISILFCDDNCFRLLLFARNCHENEVAG